MFLFVRLNEEGNPVFCWRSLPNDDRDYWRTPNKSELNTSYIPEEKMIPTDIKCSYTEYRREEVWEKGKLKFTIFVEENISREKFKDIVREYFNKGVF